MLKSATQPLKPDKTDHLLEVTSDCFRGVPDILYDLLTTTLKSYITHGPPVYTDTNYYGQTGRHYKDCDQQSDNEYVRLCYHLCIYNKHLYLDDHDN